MAHKWSRPETVERILADFDLHGQDVHRAAAQAYRDRSETGRLPENDDPNHEIGQFISGNYAVHRF